MRVIGFAAPRIARVLQEKGGVLAAPPAGFIVKAKKGPLCAGELDRAVDWLQLTMGALDPAHTPLLLHSPLPNV